LNSLRENKDKLSKIESARKNALFTYIQKKYRNIPSLVANEIAEQTVKKCEELNAPFVVIVGIMEAESGFNPSKTSNKRARKNDGYKRGRGQEARKLSRLSNVNAGRCAKLYITNGVS
jgi:hypothetical protein